MRRKVASRRAKRIRSNGLAVLRQEGDGPNQGALFFPIGLRFRPTISSASSQRAKVSNLPTTGVIYQRSHRLHR
jgi:hypothetical protein